MGDGDIERTGKCFEDSFDLVVGIHAVERHDVQVDAGFDGECLEKVPEEIDLNLSHALSGERVTLHKVAAARTVHRDVCERLVHRHGDIRHSANSASFSQRLANSLAKADRYVLGRVMSIDVQVSARSDVQVKLPVASKESQEMIERAETSRDVRSTAAVKV